jgi:hypothetical protein
MGATNVENQQQYKLVKRLADLEEIVQGLRTNQLQTLTFVDGTTNRILIDGINGKMKVSLPTFDVTSTPNVNLLFSTDFGFIVESYLTLTSGNFFTNSTTFVDVAPGVSTPNPVPILVTLSDYRNVSFYFEAVMVCQQSDLNGNIPEARLYNATTNAAVASSVIDGTNDGVSRRVRSGALTLASGANEYKAQMQRVNGNASDFPSIFTAHLVVRVAI